MPAFKIMTNGAVIGNDIRTYESISSARLSQVIHPYLPPTLFWFGWHLELEWPDKTMVNLNRFSVGHHDRVINAVLRELPKPLLEGMNERRVRVAFPRMSRP